MSGNNKKHETGTKLGSHEITHMHPCRPCLAWGRGKKDGSSYRPPWGRGKKAAWGHGDKKGLGIWEKRQWNLKIMYVREYSIYLVMPVTRHAQIVHLHSHS